MTWKKRLCSLSLALSFIASTNQLPSYLFQVAGMLNRPLEIAVSQIHNPAYFVSGSLIASVACAGAGVVLRSFAIMLQKNPYLYMPGIAPERSLVPDTLTVLSLNVCFFPVADSYLYGLKPWRERIASIIDCLAAQDADLLCLQEVFDIEAAYALAEALQDRYAHFYMHIAPKSIGLSSGLWVASRYKMEDPHFVLFSGMVGREVFGNKGVFDFKVVSQNVPFAHILNTHLLSEAGELAAKLREKHLASVMSRIDRDVAIPTLVVGDLNIHYEGEEYHRHSFFSYFKDLFHPKSETYSSYFEDCVRQIINGPHEKAQILDYSLLLKPNREQGSDSKAQIVPMYHLENPQRALSDHHGLYTILRPLHNSVK